MDKKKAPSAKDPVEKTKADIGDAATRKKRRATRIFCSCPEYIDCFENEFCPCLERKECTNECLYHGTTRVVESYAETKAKNYQPPRTGHRCTMPRRVIY